MEAAEKGKISSLARHRTPAVQHVATPTELTRLRLYTNVTGDMTDANFRTRLQCNPERDCIETDGNPISYRTPGILVQYTKRVSVYTKRQSRCSTSVGVRAKRPLFKRVDLMIPSLFCCYVTQYAMHVKMNTEYLNVFNLILLCSLTAQAG